MKENQKSFIESVLLILIVMSVYNFFDMKKIKKMVNNIDYNVADTYNLLEHVSNEIE